tara:strand:+ start:698 stop:856 length:159 start_codon:yes stop_codon:yes gene_type:complete
LVIERRVGDGGDRAAKETFVAECDNADADCDFSARPSPFMEVEEERGGDPLK